MILLDMIEDVVLCIKLFVCCMLFIWVRYVKEEVCDGEFFLKFENL